MRWIRVKEDVTSGPASFHVADFLATAARAPVDTRLWVVMAVSAVVVIYLTYRQSAKARKADPLSDKPFRMTLAQQKAIERDMQSLLVEMHQMARQMTAQLETRAARLELLIEEADAKIARLEGRPGAKQPVKMRLAVDDEEPAAPEETTPDAVAVADSAPEASPHAEIFRLAEEGLDARLIAQKLARPLGEIELVLALRPRDDRPEPPSIATNL